MQRKLRQSGVQETRGQSYIELAIALPALLVLVMGLVEVALLMRAQLVLTNATREGARLASRGVEAEEAAHRAMFAFSHQLPARTGGPDANTGIVITQFYAPALPEDPPITMTTYYSGTAMSTITGTCATRVPGGYWNDLMIENQGFDSSHDVAIIEICHNYHLAFFPVARALYDKTTMRIAAQRVQ
jgi:Flp pilus assembly protein TadG